MPSKGCMKLETRSPGACLELGREHLENVVNLVLEPAGKHLIGLVEREDLDVVRAQGAAAEHVVHAARGADNDVHTSLAGEETM